MGCEKKPCSSWCELKQSIIKNGLGIHLMNNNVGDNVCLTTFCLSDV